MALLSYQGAQISMWAFFLSLVNTNSTDWDEAPTSCWGHISREHPALLPKKAFEGIAGGRTGRSARRRVKLLVLSLGSLPPSPQPTCSRFQNKIRQSSMFNSNTVAQTSTLRTCVSGLPVSSENWGSRTQSGSCTNDPCHAGTEHGTSGLLDELLKLNSRHSCHCGFHTSSVRTSCTSAFCVAKKKELELGPSQNTPTLCQCAIQHVWPHAGWTTEL